MSPRIVEQLSPQPFRQWCAWRLDPRGWDRPNSTPTEDAAVEQLAIDLGIGDRKLRRWRNENRTLERIEVEEALHHAGVGFWEVYPDADLPVGFLRPQHEPGYGSYLTDDQVRELHAAHVAGASIRVLASRIYQKAGYKTPASAQYGIRKGFQRLGLRAILRHPKHLATTRRCGLPTSDGTPCENTPAPGSDLCWTHRFPVEARANVFKATEARLAA